MSAVDGVARAEGVSGLVQDIVTDGDALPPYARAVYKRVGWLPRSVRWLLLRQHLAPPANSDDPRCRAPRYVRQRTHRQPRKTRVLWSGAAQESPPCRIGVATASLTPTDPGLRVDGSQAIGYPGTA